MSGTLRSNSTTINLYKYEGWAYILTEIILKYNRPRGYGIMGVQLRAALQPPIPTSQDYGGFQGGFYLKRPSLGRKTPSELAIVN